jgi:C-terminal processing protease CtpA/Prc
LLDIKSFGGLSDEIDSIFNIILNKNYKNLIIDLRNNSGGGLNSAISFGEYISNRELNAGFFVTNNWYRDSNNKNDTLNFSRIPVTSATSTSTFIEELKHTIGKQLVIAPGKKTFKGKVYILTSNKTASTCEPIIYALKKNKLATVVGERTAGAMLSASIFRVSDKYYIFLPIADYYTSDGQRLDQIGVEPNVIVNSEDALNFVIDNLLN